MDTQHRVPWLPGCIELQFTATKKPPLHRRNRSNSAGITLLSPAEQRRGLGSSYLVDKPSKKSVVWRRVEFVFGECFSVYTGWADHRIWSTRWCVVVDWRAVFAPKKYLKSIFGPLIYSLNLNLTPRKWLPLFIARVTFSLWYYQWAEVTWWDMLTQRTWMCMNDVYSSTSSAHTDGTSSVT